MAHIVVKKSFTRHGIERMNSEIRFSHHEIREKLECDNGNEFAKFSKQYGFIHATPDLTHAQSNGLAEKTAHIW